MFVVVWHFEIAEEKVAAFEAAYGPAGAWAQLFRASPNYMGTELLRDAYIPGFYLNMAAQPFQPSQIERFNAPEAFFQEPVINIKKPV